MMKRGMEMSLLVRGQFSVENAFIRSSAVSYEMLHVDFPFYNSVYNTFYSTVCD